MSGPASIDRPWERRRLHFVGVGGAGMSGYARAAHALGAQVSGSDRADSENLRALSAEGVLDPAIGHDAANLPSGEGVELVYSSAIPPENPERAEARARGVPEHPRAELLRELTALRRTVAVAGAHGKTTTASMIAWVLRASGEDPSWLIGSSIGDGLPNSHWGGGEWLVVEADESDRSMLALHVEIAVLTNVELDHHSTFSSLGELREAFRQFLACPTRAIVVWDRPELLELAPAAEGRNTPEIVAYDAHELRLSEGGSLMRWRDLHVALAVPGRHNACNATAALEAARLTDVAPVDAVAAIAGFGGAGRRFQRLGKTPSGALVVDDYAHHPTEVAATIEAARTLHAGPSTPVPRGGRGRVVAVFQPHLYSRTALLAREFGEALALADVAVVLDVYPARERPEDYPGVSGLVIARAASERSGGKPVYWLPTFERAQQVLEGLLGPQDLCLAMGAGDVDELARRLVARSEAGT